MIITVKDGDTLFSLSQQYDVPVSKIASDNGIYNMNLVVGQSLIIDIPMTVYIAGENTTVDKISEREGVSKKQLFRNNYMLSGRNDVEVGTYVVIEYENAPEDEKIIGGYAYDFIDVDRLSSVINYLTYVMPFTYGFDENGELIDADDYYILAEAVRNDVKALMHISTLTQEGTFDSNLPSFVFENEQVQNRLLENIISKVLEKGYYGVDVDFEYLEGKYAEDYAAFLSRLSEALHEYEKILVVALPPKTSDEQRGLLYEGIDYKAIGKAADYVLIMAYEYGYRFGPPLAIAPVNQVRSVLDYAIERIDAQKILLGISNYGYDWTLPYERGVTDAPSISTVEAVGLAQKYGAQIMFDDVAMAPFFFYTDDEGLEHEVWYEDARSFEAKFDLIEEYNLSGGFIWELLRENPQGYVTINSRVRIM